MLQSLRPLFITLGLLAFGLLPSASATVITFEGIADSTPAGSLYASEGVTFTNATVITAGVTLNEFEFPPHSGVNVAFDDGGFITVDFSSAQSFVGAYFTYSEPLTFSAYSASNALLGSVHSAFSSNMALSGDPGSSPNEFLSLSDAGIRSIVVAGDPAGSSFVMDDLTFNAQPTSTVPEPSYFMTIGGGLLTLILTKLRGRLLLVVTCLLIFVPSALYCQQVSFALAMDQSHGYVSEPLLTTFTTFHLAPDPKLIPASVELLEVQADGTFIKSVGEMFDDGTHGDQVAGDNTFSLRIPVTFDKPGGYFYQISVAYKESLKRVKSSISTLVITKHLTAAELDADQTLIESLQDGADDIYEAAIAAGANQSSAIAKAFQWLKQKSAVSVVSFSSTGISFKVSSGYGGLIDFSVLPGIPTLASPSAQFNLNSPPPIPFSPTNGLTDVQSSSTTNPQSNNADAATTPSTCGGTRLLALAPFDSEFVSLDLEDAALDIANLATTTMAANRGGCPLSVTEYKDSDITVQNMGRFSEGYGAVAMSTHAGVTPDGLVVFSTHDLVNADSRYRYGYYIANNLIWDIKAGHPKRHYWGIPPAFVQQQLPFAQRTIIYMHACDSAANDSLANAFWQQGASVYLGYSWYTCPVVNGGESLFKSLINGKSVAQSLPFFSIGLTAFGDQTVSFPDNVILNGSFETGDYTGWARSYYGGSGGTYSTDVNIVNTTAANGTYSVAIGEFNPSEYPNLERVRDGNPFAPHPYWEINESIDYLNGLDSFQNIQLPNSNHITLSFSYRHELYVPDICVLAPFVTPTCEDQGLWPTTKATTTFLFSSGVAPDLFTLPQAGPSYNQSLVIDASYNLQRNILRDTGWINVSFDLTPYKGQLFSMNFLNQWVDQSAQAATFIDNVRITCR